MNNNPMVDELNRLVADLLVQGKELFLPGLGTLYIEQRGAQRLSKRSVLPPSRVVSFTSQERGESLVSVIAAAASCDQAEAQDIYERWLAQTCVDDVLTVAGAGVLKLKFFTPEPGFDARLNPQGHKPVRIQSRRGADWVIWVGVIAMLIALVALGYYLLPSLLDRGTNHPAAIERTAEKAPQTPAAQIPATGGAEPAAPTTADTPPANTAPATPAQTTPANAKTEPAATAAASGAAAQTAPTTPAATPAASPTTPAALTAGTHYVVLGVYSTAENAARAARDAAAKTPSLQCRVYRFGEKFMVSPYSSADAAASAQFVREHAREMRDLWIHTAR